MSERIAAELAAHRQLRSAILSIDDLYLSKAARAALARDVHPLLRTRGVPGTHDIELGKRVMAELADTRSGAHTRIPRFNKAKDDVRPETEWELFEGPADVVLFEGWCVGARAEPVAALETPINALERDEDKDGVWRGYVNAALRGPYQALFDRIDCLILLKAPDFDVVFNWRRQQEQELEASYRAAGRQGAFMSDAELRRFIMHYERLTRHILSDMPNYADVVASLSADRSVAGLVAR